MGKKSKKKEAAATKVNEISEVDKTFYELQITDLNRKLSRLREHTTALEEKNQDLEQNFLKLDDDRGDVIVYLKRNLQQKQNEVSELQERLTAIQELKEAEAKEHDKVLEELENEFKQMKEQLSSEIKLLNGKLNALEEFRQQREEIMQKYEEQEKNIEEQEERHKKVLYEIEKKFILEKDVIKKEMEHKVIALSSNFEKANELRIAATTQRAIRENISLNHELNHLIIENERLEKENNGLKAESKVFQLNFELVKSERNKAISDARIQRGVIDQLKENHETLSSTLTEHAVLIRKGKVTQENWNQSESHIENLQEKIKILEQNLHMCRSQQTQVKEQMYAYSTAIEKFRVLFSTAREHVRAAMDVTSQQKIDESEKYVVRENLAQTLLSLLTQSYENFAKPLASQTLPSAAYGRGDLGFIPKVHKTKRPTWKLRAITKVGPSLEDFIYDEIDEEIISDIGNVVADDHEDIELSIYEESIPGESEGSEKVRKTLIIDEDDEEDEEKPAEEKPTEETGFVEGIEVEQELFGEDEEAERHHQEILDAITGPFSFDDETENDTSPSEADI